MKLNEYINLIIQPSMTVLSGKDFNDKYSTNEFYKVLNKDSKHHNFTYKHGLNVDHIPFNPTSSCCAGGLYFAELNKLAMWIYSDSCYIAKVTIPTEASVYTEANSFKADKFILDFNNKVLVHDFYIWTNEELSNQAICKNACVLQFVKNQTEEICKLAVQQMPSVLRYVKVQTEEICETAVTKDGFALQYVINQTDNMCKLAVKQNGAALHLVKTQTDEICKLAVNQHVNALYHVKDQTAEICEMALDKDVQSLQFVRGPTLEILEYAFKKGGNGHLLKCLAKQTEEICNLAVKYDGHALSYMNTLPTYEQCKIAVQQNGICLIHVKFQTDELRELAIQQNPEALQYVVRTTDEVHGVGWGYDNWAITWRLDKKD